MFKGRNFPFCNSTCLHSYTPPFIVSSKSDTLVPSTSSVPKETIVLATDSPSNDLTQAITVRAPLPKYLGMRIQEISFCNNHSNRI